MRGEPLLVDIRRAAEILGVSPKVLYERVARGDVPPELVVRWGRRLWFRRVLLLRWAGAASDEERSDRDA